MQHKISDKYSFLIEKDERAIRIELVQAASGQTKVFSQAGGCLENLTKHMLSLTDIQCGDWFKGARPKQDAHAVRPAKA